MKIELDVYEGIETLTLDGIRMSLQLLKDMCNPVPNVTFRYKRKTTQYGDYIEVTRQRDA